MKCPDCSDELKRTSYEGVTVFECPECGGYLVDRRKMVLIKSSREQSREELESEAESGSGRDSTEDIRCPKCRVRRMTKQRVPAGDDESFHVDLCGKCNVVWFEAGELARMQLHYEDSAQGIESLGRQQRAAGLATDDDDEFEKNLAALPKHPHVLSQALKDAWLQVLTVLLLIASAVLAFDYPWIAAAVSVPAVVLLGMLAIPSITGAVGRWSLLAVIAACELGFLAWLFN